MTYLLRFLNGDLQEWNGDELTNIPSVVARQFGITASRVQYMPMHEDTAMIAVFIQPPPHLVLEVNKDTHVKLLHHPLWLTTRHPTLLRWIRTIPNALDVSVSPHLIANPDDMVVEWILEKCAQIEHPTRDWIRKVCRNRHSRILDWVYTRLDARDRLEAWCLMSNPDPRASQFVIDYVRCASLTEFEEWRILIRLFAHTRDESTLSYILERAADYLHELPMNPHPFVIEWRRSVLSSPSAYPLLFLNACLETGDAELDRLVTDYFLSCPERLEKLCRDLMGLDWAARINESRLIEMLLALSVQLPKLNVELQKNPHALVVDSFLAHPDAIVLEAWCQNPNERVCMDLLQRFAITSSDVPRAYEILQATVHVELVEWFVLNHSTAWKEKKFEIHRWQIVACHPRLPVTVLE